MSVMTVDHSGWGESIELDETFDLDDEQLPSMRHMLRRPLNVIAEFPHHQVKEIKRSVRKWSPGDGPGEDTIVMEEADAVLSRRPPRLFRPSPMATETQSKSISVSDSESTRENITTPIAPPSRQRRSPLSTLSSDVEKVIQYLDEFRFTPTSQQIKENIPQGIPTSNTRSFRPNVQSKSKVNVSGKHPSLSTKKHLRRVLTNHTNDTSVETKLHYPNEIFRPTSSASRAPPSIHLAESVHSNLLSAPSFLKDSELQSSVQNLINSICIEHDKTNGWDVDVLDKIQKQVQELLQQIRHEREKTHEWVSTMRAAVEEWVEEQRKLIACERRHAKERVAQLLIQEQANKIRLLESKLLREKQTNHPKTPGVQFKTYGVQFKTPGRDPLQSTIDDSFFAEVDQHESPTLPHLLPSDPVRSKRCYITLSDGRKRIKFRNGTGRDYMPDGSVVTRYMNGDIKTHMVDGTMSYWHANDHTKQTVYSNGEQLFEYPNKQIERHFPDGRKDVTFPNGVKRTVREK